MTLKELNTLERAAFVDAIGWSFEHSPWVAERAWAARPFDTLAALHAAMVAVLEQATAAEQLALIRAHPDLGARIQMSDASRSEQTGSGLDSLSPTEFARLQSLNSAYREKFGFPFIYAVKGATKQQIVGALESRIDAEPGAERHAALGQIYRIAQFRLESTLSCTDS